MLQFVTKEISTWVNIILSLLINRLKRISWYKSFTMMWILFILDVSFHIVYKFLINGRIVPRVTVFPSNFVIWYFTHKCSNKYSKETFLVLTSLFELHVASFDFIRKEFHSFWTRVSFLVPSTLNQDIRRTREHFLQPPRYRNFRVINGAMRVKQNKINRDSGWFVRWNFGWQ